MILQQKTKILPLKNDDFSSTGTLSFIDGPRGSFKYEGKLGTNFSEVRWDTGATCVSIENDDSSIESDDSSLENDDVCDRCRRAPTETVRDAATMECCDTCTKNTECRAWTMDSAATGCQLTSTAATAYPVMHLTSGYPLKADAATYCQVRSAIVFLPISLVFLMISHDFSRFFS